MSRELNHPYIEPLTDREMEVLQCLADSLSNKEIAKQLIVEVSTVKWHNAQIYSKLQVKNRNQAVIRAQTLGMIQVDTAASAYRLRHNLPTDPIPFIGRVHEIEQLTQQLLDNKSRLVTILGAGGMGKTRLAIEVGQRLVPHFHNGVYFVPFATISSTEELLTTIAEAIGYQFYSEIEPRQQLLEYIQRQHVLLIIDNFEHLLGHSMLLSDILKVAPRVKMLVTTREKLCFGGEAVHLIDGLSTPADGNKDVPAYDAVKLFMEASNRTASQIGQDDLSDVALVCRMLGGMPLAILLATAWLDTLTLGEIKAELEDSLAILEANFRNMPVRHQSINTVFDYSFRRLTAHEQDIFIRLTVFRGGFTRQAAEVVVATNINDLQRLVHTSFIQHSNDGRYTLHELMRQYGESKLKASDELNTVRERHAQFFADFIAPLNSMPVGMTTRDMLEWVSADFHNIRHAWKFQAERRDYEALRQFLDSICLFSYEWGRGQEAIDLFERVLLSLQDQEQDEILFRGQLLARISFLFHDLGQRQKARELAQESLKILQMFDATNDISLMYLMQIVAMRYMNNLEDSLAFAEKGYLLARKTMNPKWLVNFRTQLAICHSDLGNYAESERWVDTLPDYSRKAMTQGANLIGRSQYSQAEDFLLKWLTKKHYSRHFNIRLCTLLTEVALHQNKHSKSWDYVRYDYSMVMMVPLLGKQSEYFLLHCQCLLLNHNIKPQPSLCR